MHIGQSLYVKVYALGVGSAILVTLPYSIYLFYRLINEDLISVYDIVINAPYGILTIVLVLGGHKLAHKILPD